LKLPSTVILEILPDNSSNVLNDFAIPMSAVAARNTGIIKGTILKDALSPRRVYL
jgi:hypothetical protein